MSPRTHARSPADELMGEEKAPATARAGLLTSEDEASMDQISPKAQPSMAAMEEGRAEVPGGDPVDGVSLVASLPRRESATDEARPADAVARHLKALLVCIVVFSVSAEEQPAAAAVNCTARLHRQRRWLVYCARADRLEVKSEHKRHS